MIKSKKKQIDVLLEMMAQAHIEFQKFMECGKYQEAAQILADCQEAAITIGQTIEKAEGESTETVKRLVEYCEILYSIYEEVLSKEKAADTAKDAARLEHSYQKIMSCYKEEIPIVKEVVFLPYKASMWDSLEGIWEKYAADPAWDAKVVPIPYFDKNPDGTMQEYHYEGGLYPEDVPVIPYQEYDLKEHHPEEIYIHNPYDNGNFVTSVHPDYYSKNLKKYTDKLIYVPYFVLPEPDPENTAHIENIAHYAQTPGVIHADEVIVQSENMRKCYIEALTRLGGEQTRKIWEHKIKGTGSPKFERAKNTKKEEVGIPEVWRKKIYRANGTARKVILYNTSVVAFLEESSGMLEKIEDVLAFFKEKREEAVLLWRPHPLIRATMSAMRPALVDQYDQMVKKYIAEDFGIYDDSSDLDRAIATADAYYGDKSSVVQLCQSVGMPVMIQNVSIRWKADGNCGE